MGQNHSFKTLYDPGTAKPSEDGFVVAPPFFGVFDAVSPLYDPELGPKLFDGRSGGQKATDIVVATVKQAQGSESAKEIMTQVNQNVREFCEAGGLNLAEADNLPGLEFVLAKITDEGIEIVQAGDAFAVWVTRNGEVGATPNQNYAYEARQIEIIQKLIREHDGDRKSAWKEYMPLTRKFRREHANKSGAKDYVVLNGDGAGEKLWYKKFFSPDELKTLILFTDGLVNFDDTKDEKDLAKLVVGTYTQGGLPALLSRIRGIENQELGQRHVDHAEATGVVIEL